MKKVNLGILDAASIVMESLTMLFGKQHDISLHSTAKSVEEFLENNGIEDIDVLLLDINLPGMSGFEGMRMLKDRMPKADLIMLTTYEDEQIIFKALCGGATSYISKRTPLESVLNAVRTVVKGGS